MRTLQAMRLGLPHEAVALVEVPDPEPPAAGEVLIEVEAAPINPADLAFLAGTYGRESPPLPAPLGAEGVGRVSAMGPGVTHLAVGDRVLLPGRDSWRERVVARAERLFAVPQEADLLQLAMLKVNPPTAWLLLTSFVNLAPGDWLIQNAANSAVGAAVIALARTMGLRTVNVVRREALITPLTAAGGDVVLVDGPDLAERVAAATGGAGVRLALDAVGGEATQRLAASLADGGTVVNYGLLSGQPCQVAARETIFRDITLRGFWLVRWLTSAPPAEIQATYGRLAGMLVDGTLRVPVEVTYPLDRYREALAHASREGRGGKVLFTPAADRATG